MQVKAFKAAGRNDLNLKITWAKEAISGLQCIHEEHHVWTDIKAENYVNFYNEHLDLTEIKCIDFDSVIPQGEFVESDPLLTATNGLVGRREPPCGLYSQDNAT
jgi:hypothetical protein